MPIFAAPVGVELKVTKVLADDKTKRHLENLGILTGSNVTLVSQSNGNIIVKIKDGRIAINKQLAMKILVA